jgi:dTDP-4-amino-4,6-dideoxygalactose transaminase
MDPLIDIAKRRKLSVIEDACQAHGALYKGRKVGSIGDVGCFSFYPGKNLGCYGDGGILVTNNETVYKKAHLLRDHGRSDKYTHIAHGYNFRLDAMQAAILHAKLRHLNEWNGMRRRHAAAYSEALAGAKGVTRPVEKPYAKHVWHLYVIRAGNRDGLKAFLKEKGVDTGVHYPIPLNKQPVYVEMKLCQTPLPVSESCAKGVLSLPIYAEMSDAEVSTVAGLVKEFAGN